MQLDLPICEGMSQKMPIKKKNSPLNLRERDTVKALPDSGLHVVCCLHSGGHTVLIFGCSPVLFDIVEFAMVFWVFWVKVTNVAM
jgi:hypothetical protein